MSEERMRSSLRSTVLWLVTISSPRVARPRWAIVGQTAH
jgi:hypothetical protein